MDQYLLVYYRQYLLVVDVGLEFDTINAGLVLKYLKIDSVPFSFLFFLQESKCLDQFV